MLQIQFYVPVYSKFLTGFFFFLKPDFDDDFRVSVKLLITQLFATQHVHQWEQLLLCMPTYFYINL